MRFFLISSFKMINIITIIKINNQNKGKKMNKLTKILLVVLSTLSIAINAIAGELTVTGTAKANYSIGGKDAGAGKGIGITNEVGLGATGELDNGMTWSYALALDTSATDAVVDQDDQSLTLTTPYGTLGAFITAGGLSTEHSWGIGAIGVGSDLISPMTSVFGSDVSTYSNVQYHLPAGLLPLGIVAKVGHAPNLANNETYAADYKSVGNVNSEELGKSATHYQVSAAPVAGLTVIADYFETAGARTKGQAPTSGNISAKYTTGPVTIGYRKGYSDVGITAKSTAVTNYDNDAYGIQFAFNDQLSVSYSVEKTTARTRAAIVATKAGAVKTDKESTLTHIQAAYNIGGATVGIARVEGDDSDYTTSKDESITLLSIAMAF